MANRNRNAPPAPAGATAAAATVRKTKEEIFASKSEKLTSAALTALVGLQALAAKGGYNAVQVEAIFRAVDTATVNAETAYKSRPVAGKPSFSLSAAVAEIVKEEQAAQVEAPEQTSEPETTDETAPVSTDTTQPAG